MLSITTKPLYTHEDIAEMIGKPVGTIYNIITSKRPCDERRKAKLPPFKRLHTGWVVSATDLIAWLACQPVVVGCIDAPDLPPVNKGGRPRKTNPTVGHAQIRGGE